jgi:hypothetical protein
MPITSSPALTSPELMPLPPVVPCANAGTAAISRKRAIKIKSFVRIVSSFFYQFRQGGGSGPALGRWRLTLGRFKKPVLMFL